MKKKIAVFTPFHINKPEILPFFEYQRKISPLIKKEFENNHCEVIRIGTLDKDVTNTIENNPNFDEFDVFLDLRSQPANGIVEPTKKALAVAKQLNADIFHRFNQDIVIKDIKQAVEIVIATNDNTVVGAKSKSSRNLLKHLKEIGIDQVPTDIWAYCLVPDKTPVPIKRLFTYYLDKNSVAVKIFNLLRIKPIGYQYDFISGNWVVATLNTWLNHYHKLPKSINHGVEDTLFSYFVEVLNNGALVFIDNYQDIWVHNPKDFNLVTKEL